MAKQRAITLLAPATNQPHQEHLGRCQSHAAAAAYLVEVASAQDSCRDYLPFLTTASTRSDDLPK